MKNQNRTISKMKAILLTAALAVSASYGYAQRENNDYLLFTELEYGVDTTVNANNTQRQSQSQAARNWCRHELSLWGAGGWSSLYYRPVVGEKGKLPLGGEFGLGYTFYFTQHLGLMLGAELAYYQNKISLFGVYDNYNTKDISPYTAQEGEEDINFRYRTDNYTERQTMWALNIPLMLQLQTNRWGNHRLYAGLGAKLGIPLTTKFSGKHGTITSMGYYYAYDQIDNEETTQLGYGQFDNQSAAGKLNVGLSIIGTVEAGVKWYLGKNIDLYTGVYGEYGFNNILRGKRDKQFVELTSYAPETGSFHLNSVLLSQNNNGILDLKERSIPENAGTTRAIADKLSPAAFGLKLRLGFGVGCPIPADEKQSKKTSDGEANKSNCKNCNPHLEAARKAAEAARDAAEAARDVAKTLRNTSVEKDDTDVYGRRNADVRPRVRYSSDDNAHRDAAETARDAAEILRNKPVEKDNTDAYGRRNADVRPRVRYASDDNAQQEIDDYLAAARERRNRHQQRLGSINYNVNIAELTKVQEKTLDNYVDLLKQNQHMTMDITGHACNLGTHDYNMWIGQERADLAKDYLVSRGIRPSRIATFSKGDTEPIVPNNSDANRKKNRRLELQIVR